MKKSRSQLIELIKVTVALIVISGGILTMGIMCLISGVQEILQAQASVDWPVADGIIIQSKFDVKCTGSSTSGNRDRSDSSYSYTLMIKYQYEVNESLIIGDKVSWEKGISKQIVESMVNRYPLDKKVKVHYDPADPKISVLEPEKKEGLLLLPFFGIIFIVIAAISGVLIWKFGAYSVNILLGISALILLVIFVLFLLKFIVRA